VKEQMISKPQLALNASGILDAVDEYDQVNNHQSRGVLKYSA
jgi:hypothetical protein